jgi:hypothetical protein
MDRLGAPWCICGIGWQIADDRRLWSAVSAGKSLMIDAFGLLSLTELVTSLTRNDGLDR